MMKNYPPERNFLPEGHRDDNQGELREELHPYGQHASDGNDLREDPHSTPISQGFPCPSRFLVHW